MSVTIEQVHQALEPDEADSAQPRAHNPAALRYLPQPISSRDRLFTSKSRHAKGFSGTPAPLTARDLGGRRAVGVVRVSAAAATGTRPLRPVSSVLMFLLKETDWGVRRQALQSSVWRTQRMRKVRVRLLGATDRHAQLRAAEPELAKLCIP